MQDTCYEIQVDRHRNNSGHIDETVDMAGAVHSLR